MYGASTKKGIIERTTAGHMPNPLQADKQTDAPLSLSPFPLSILIFFRSSFIALCDLPLTITVTVICWLPRNGFQVGYL